MEHKTQVCSVSVWKIAAKSRRATSFARGSPEMV